MDDAALVRRLKKLRDNLPLYADEILKIQAKSGALMPFRLNRAQKFLHQRMEDQKRRTGKVRVLIGKGRQTGGSTYVGARFYHRTSMRKGVSTYILTHEQDASDNLFEMVTRFHDHNPLKPSTGAANAKELYFDKLSSGYTVGTAGTKAAGRSSTIHLLHWCMAEGTLILAPDGRLKPIEDFRPGDLVRTHRNESAPVTAISQQIKPCHRVVFRSLTSFPLVLTGEHRIWTRAGWAMVDDLDVGDAIGFPVRSISHEISALPFRLAALRRGGNKPHGPDQITLGDDLGRIVGLYLAEGSIVRQWTTGAPSGVTFTVHENEVDRTVAWLQPFKALYRSLKVAPSSSSKTVHVTVYGKSIATFLDALVGSLDTKQLPDQWWLMGEVFVRGMVHGYLSGDGHFSPAKNRIIEATSVREAITTGMRDALASLGYGWASIKHNPAGLRHGRYERAAFVLRLCGSGVETLSIECAKPYFGRQRRDLGNHGNVRIEDGYAWLSILSKAPVGERRVFDFEVGHDDHSYCTIHGATHNSEVAYSPNAAGHSAGLVQTVPDLPGTEIVKESTGNGPEGEFYESWQVAEGGRGDYEALFLPWFWSDDYYREVPPGFSLTKEEREYQQLHGVADGAMVWRRAKIDELKSIILFQREYPATATEMWSATGKQSYIRPDLVLAARKGEREGIGPLVVGVDPARFGDDRFSVAWRRGRKVSKIESRLHIGTTEALAWLRDIIDQDKPAKMFIDAGGGGDRLFDMLQSWGKPYSDIVVLVNFGSKPQTEVLIADDGTKRAGPQNRRAEMWMRSLEWLEQTGGADLPDSDALQSDACGPSYHYSTTDQRLVLESKEQMRARNVRSPDEWDAVVLTFAEPVKERPSDFAKPRVRTMVASGEASHSWLGA